MPITIGFCSWEQINHFPFISYRKFRWYKSKDLERIKDVHRGTTVYQNHEIDFPFAVKILSRMYYVSIYVKVKAETKRNRESVLERNINFTK
jgi:hypothetical protein